MPELVACPSCSCKVGLSEGFLGRRTRCIACSAEFVAAPGVDPPTPAVLPLPAAGGPGWSRLPLCPGCHQPVAWDAPACPGCDLPLDPADADGQGEWACRRDARRHRGPLIETLGSVCLWAGVLSLCVAPLAVPVGLLTGLPALLMARHDLSQMRRGAVDPGGRRITELGRNKVVAGLVLTTLFGLFWGLMLTNRFP
jgi:hypothetical protein